MGIFKTEDEEDDMDEIDDEEDDMENRKLYFQDAHKNIQKAEHLAIKPNKRQQYRKTLLGIKNQLSR